MSKKTQNGRKSLLTGASVLAAAAAALAGTPAMAQDAEEEDAIVVTGTRLVRQDFEAISPITTVGAEQLELTATLTTDSLLNELPQIVPGNTRTSNNSGGEDFATVDLRGLGPGRTLVLINGERIPASSTTGTVDINTIPASLISRIEVVTGGASTVYGSDALAGVVNFVLKDDYEGAEITATYGAELETGNAAEFEINGLVGGNFANGRGNMTTYASYYNRTGVLQSEYDYSRTSGALCYDSGLGSNVYFVCDSSAEAVQTTQCDRTRVGSADSRHRHADSRTALHPAGQHTAANVGDADLRHRLGQPTPCSPEDRRERYGGRCQPCGTRNVPSRSAPRESARRNRDRSHDPLRRAGASPCGGKSAPDGTGRADRDRAPREHDRQRTRRRE